MADEAIDRVLWVWTASELAVLLAAAGLTVASLVGDAPAFAAEFASVSAPVRVAVAALLVVELLIPLWVYVDCRRRDGHQGSWWVHVAAMPGINLLGLAAYLHERGRTREPA